MNKTSKLLINEPPLQVSPSLAAIIGLNEAIFIQQLNYWLMNPKIQGAIIDGEKWIFNSVREWRENNFPFWSEHTIIRTIQSLKDYRVLLVRQAVNSSDRRNMYRIDYERLDELTEITENGEKHTAKMEECILPKWKNDTSKMEESFSQNGEMLINRDYNIDYNIDYTETTVCVANAFAFAPEHISLSRNHDEHKEQKQQTPEEYEHEPIQGARYLNPFQERAKRGQKQSALSAEKRENSSTKEADRQVTGKLESAVITPETTRIDPPQGSTGKLPASYDEEVEKPEKGKRFKPPTVEEVRAYCAERKNSVDAEKFVDFYESKGWMVGSNRMKNWQAAVRTWERKDAVRTAQAPVKPPVPERRKTLVELMAEQEAAERAKAESDAKIIDGSFADGRSWATLGGYLEGTW